jgi:hypothetical protein
VRNTDKKTENSFSYSPATAKPEATPIAYGKPINMRRYLR